MPFIRGSSVAKRKTDRFDMRVEAAWLARVERQAERYGLTVAAYIRRATTQAVEADEATDPDQKEEDE